MSRQQRETAEHEFNQFEDLKNTMELKNIAAAFVKAKKSFSPALKTSTNPHFKSRYADLAACVEAVDDSFLANGIVMYQETFQDDTGVMVETVLLHESGEQLRCGKLHVPASKQDAQGYGSALSYARRYSLMAACGIAPEDDDGNAATKAKPVVKTLESGSAPKIEFSRLPEGKQSNIRDMVLVLGEFTEAENYAGGFETLQSFGLDADDKVALWSQLDSKTRSAFKRIGELQKAVA